MSEQTDVYSADDRAWLAQRDARRERNARIIDKWAQAQEALLDCLITLADPGYAQVIPDAGALIAGVGTALGVMVTAANEQAHRRR